MGETSFPLGIASAIEGFELFKGIIITGQPYPQCLGTRRGHERIPTQQAVHQETIDGGLGRGQQFTPPFRQVERESVLRLPTLRLKGSHQ